MLIIVFFMIHRDRDFAIDCFPFGNFRGNESCEQKLLNNIRKCAAAVNTNVIEHTAFIRASAAQNNIDLDQYREEVHRELVGSNTDNEHQKKGKYYPGSMHLSLFKQLFNCVQKTCTKKMTVTQFDP